MTSKKDPPDPAHSPVDPLAGQPLEVVVEVLATAAGQLGGLQGAELAKHIREVMGQVQHLVTTVEQRVQNEVQDEEQRKAAAQEVERLVDMFSRTGTAAGNALARHRDQIAATFRGVDLQKVAEGMRVLADWMANPSAEKEAEAKALLEKLQTTMGPLVGYDPAADEEKRRAEIKADVKKSLDEIFRPKKPT